MTPRSVVKVFARGFRPEFHSTVGVCGQAKQRGANSPVLGLLGESRSDSGLRDVDEQTGSSPTESCNTLMQARRGVFAPGHHTEISVADVGAGHVTL